MLTAYEVAKALTQHKTQKLAAKALGVPRTTLIGFIQRNNLDSPEGISNALGQEFSVEAEFIGDIPKLISSRGLDPSDVEVTNIRLNEYGKCGECGSHLKQNRVDLKPRVDFLIPARTEGWKPPKPAKSQKATEGLVAFFGDQHVPRHHKALHSMACQWLKENRPAKLILLGDLLDNEYVSRHRKFQDGPSAQECVDMAWGVLRDYREASPDTEVLFVDGNHEDRVRISVADQIPGVRNLTRAGGGPAVLSTEHLLRFDELGIEAVHMKGGYEHSEIRVSKTLVARHGHIAKKGSGVSALATLAQLRRNVVIGHTHRQGLVYITHWDIDGNPHRLMCCEAGTMAEIANGMDYASAGVPDWQQGFATAQLFGDYFTVELAVFVNNGLLWRDQKYEL
jgi:predicted phosphodiesterase